MLESEKNGVIAILWGGKHPRTPSNDGLGWPQSSATPQRDFSPQENPAQPAAGPVHPSAALPQGSPAPAPGRSREGQHWETVPRFPWQGINFQGENRPSFDRNPKTLPVWERSLTLQSRVLSESIGLPSPARTQAFPKRSPCSRCIKTRWKKEQATASFPNSQTSPSTAIRNLVPRDAAGCPSLRRSRDTSTLLRGHLKAPHRLSLRAKAAAAGLESCFRWDGAWPSFGNLQRPRFGIRRLIPPHTDAN